MGANLGQRSRTLLPEHLIRLVYALWELIDVREGN
jgi:hypothetical protein